MYRVSLPVDTDEERALTQAEFVASLPNAATSVEATLLFVFHGEFEEFVWSTNVATRGENACRGDDDFPLSSNHRLAIG